MNTGSPYRSLNAALVSSSSYHPKVDTSVEYPWSYYEALKSYIKRLRLYLPKEAVSHQFDNQVLLWNIQFKAK